MKGKTTIQLFDAKTNKEVQRTVDTNFFTNAYKKYIEDVLNNFHLPCVGAVDLGRWCSTSPKDCMRGLLLFDSVFPENADTFFPTTQVEIGHAGGDYAGTDIYRGDFNASESGDIENGYRLVWDFATDKANGTIASVCLTTLKGGNNGYKNQGVNDSDYGYQGIASGGNPSQINGYGFLSTESGTQGRLLVGMTQDKTKMFIQTEYAGNGSRAISLYTYNMSKSNLAFAERPIAVSPISEQPYAQKADIILPNSHYLWLFVHGNTIYGFYLDRSVTPNLSYLKTYDSSLNELSSIQLDGKLPQYSEAIYFGIVGDYLYAKVYNENNLYKYNRTTGAYIEKVTGPGAFEYVGNFDNDRLILFTSGGSVYYLYNGTQYFGPFRTYFNTDRYFLRRPQLYPGTNMYLNFGNYSYYTTAVYLGFGYFGPTLFTINNLATPVIKDNTKTMKVTYDITW